MQVHLIAGKLSIGATELVDQTVEAIKTFTDTSRILTKATKSKKTADEESVNIVEDALGYKIGEEANKADEVLVAGAHGVCSYCNKKGHYRRECPDHKEWLRKIKKFKEANGGKWLSPNSWAEKKKAQKEKKEQDEDKGTTYLTQATSGNVNTNQLFDKNWAEGGSEYDSYIASCLGSHEHSRQGGMVKACGFFLC